MAARGPVNGRGPLRRSGRDLVFEIAVLLAFQAITLLLSAACSDHVGKSLIELIGRCKLLEGKMHAITPVMT